jgi:hypothetical protein
MLEQCKVRIAPHMTRGTPPRIVRVVYTCMQVVNLRTLMALAFPRHSHQGRQSANNPGWIGSWCSVV